MRRRGFTLLEATVALAILALALMAIFDLNAGAVAMHAYTKKLTVATLLARSKMTDLEQELYDKGFPADDDEQSGDFSDEGFSAFKWRAKILVPRTTGVSTDKLLAAVFNVPVDGAGGDDGLSAIAAMFGGGATAPGLPPGAQAGAGALGGAMGGLAQTQMTQFLDQISRSVREVHLTVTWREGKNVETVDVVTHVVSLGPGSDRNGSATPGEQTTTSGGAGPSGRFMNPATGREVLNPVPDGRGGFRDPATGQPLITYEEFLQRQSNPSAFNPRSPRGGGGLLPTPPKGF
jgi:general secretion pathway protein I